MQSTPAAGTTVAPNWTARAARLAEDFPAENPLVAGGRPLQRPAPGRDHDSTEVKRARSGWRASVSLIAR